MSDLTTDLRVRWAEFVDASTTAVAAAVQLPDGSWVIPAGPGGRARLAYVAWLEASDRFRGAMAPAMVDPHAPF